MARRLIPFVLLALALAFGLGVLVGRGGDRWAEGAFTDPPVADSPAALQGPLRVVDGDTFDVGGTRIRLHGVDAPENAQTCLDEAGRPWACGDWVTEEARALWDGRAAACELIETDRYGRAVSRCEVSGEDLGAALVSRGMALAYVAYSKDYVPQQEAAENARAGLWRGTFQAPWDWRKNPDLEITDVATVAAEGEDCRIKGNISGTGRIYHLPGSRHYDRTTIEEEAGERWFCTEAEAEAAGWRPPGG
jgi:endonuclease YncB( thermonuclease family)